MEALKRLLVRLLPITLFGRLALLLSIGLLIGHVLVLSMMFLMHPPMPELMDRQSFGPDGQFFMEFDPQAPPPPPPERPSGMPPGLWWDIGVRLGVLVLIAWIGARWLSAPLRRLASAAKALGQDMDHPPLPEDGPKEYRDASRLFNQMQTQIRQQRQESDRFVAAVSHDLRTPLTRLRLRAERLGDTAQKHAFQHDIVEMDAMITSTLDYLHGMVDEEAFVRLDVQALVESLADDQLDCGHAVSIAGTAAPLLGQASALRRCVANLVENAIRYGGAAHILLDDSPEQLRIEVHDPGPGLPEAELSQVLAPFYRAGASADCPHGGVGLGLSIAHDIARRHQGTLQLRNGDSAGLVAVLRLPRQPCQPA